MVEIIIHKSSSLDQVSETFTALGNNTFKWVIDQQFQGDTNEERSNPKVGDANGALVVYVIEHPNSHRPCDNNDDKDQDIV